MKKAFSKQEAGKIIDEFFLKDNFSSDEMKKIKRIAMKYKIRLGIKRRNFCKKCLNKLRGKVRIKKGYKIVCCEECGFLNKFKLNT